MESREDYQCSKNAQNCVVGNDRRTRTRTRGLRSLIPVEAPRLVVIPDHASPFVSGKERVAPYSRGHTAGTFEGPTRAFIIFEGRTPARQWGGHPRVSRPGECCASPCRADARAPGRWALGTDPTRRRCRRWRPARQGSL